MRLVVPSVEYSDHLQHTLPLWVQLVGPEHITVVTSYDDIETESVALDNGVRVLKTDAWTHHDPTFKRDVSHWHQFWRRRRGKDFLKPVFNKALALDEAFCFVPGSTRSPIKGEVCISVDADVRPFGTLPPLDTVKDGVIYGCRRYSLGPHGLKGDDMPIHGRATLRRTQHREHWFVCQGYFQMFRWHPGMRFGSYPAADAYDDDFAHEFTHSEEVPNFYVLHHGGLESTHKNWEKRITPPWVEPKDMSL